MKNKSHKMADWIKKNWLMSMIISAVVGAIVTWPLSWILPSPKVEVSNLPQKELTCTLNYGKPLFIRMTNDRDFKILFKDSEVKNPFLYSITIENTGGTPILNEDFTKPLTIDFEKSNGIVKASIIESSNQELRNEFLEKTNVKGTTLSIHDLFLNQGEACTINIITDGKPDTIRYNQRTVGMPNLTIRNTPAEKHDRFNIMVVVVLTTVIVTIITIVVFAIIDRIRYKKWRREFDEKYLKVLQTEEATDEPECEHK